MDGRTMGGGAIPRAAAGRRPPSSDRINAQIHSSIEGRPLHVRTNGVMVLPLLRIGCPQPRAPPPCRSGNADEVLRRDSWIADPILASGHGAASERPDR
jgi:hypothetical protein